MTTQPDISATPLPKRSMRTFWLVVLVCIAPVLASYLLYYGIRPEGRTNYGTLLDPQISARAVALQPMVRPVTESGFLDVLAALPTDHPRRRLTSLDDFRGRWLLVRVGPAACDAVCTQQLWVMRQLRLTTGRDRDRVERLWLVTDTSKPPDETLADYEGTWTLSVDAASLADWPEQNPGSPSVQGATASLASSHLWLVDPLGNLMMRFPSDPDPAKMKKDILKLLKASRVG
jgi:hypothetical protein